MNNVNLFYNSITNWAPFNGIQIRPPAKPPNGAISSSDALNIVTKALPNPISTIVQPPITNPLQPVIVRNPFLDNLLESALRNRDLASCQQVIELGAIISEAQQPRLERLQETANRKLQVAADQADLDLCWKLVKQQYANPNAAVDGMTFLTRALTERNLKKCNFFMDLGARPTDSERQLFNNLRRDQYEQFEKSFEEGDFFRCSQLLLSGVNLRDDSLLGTMLLDEAIQEEHLMKCKFLVDNYASLSPTQEMRIKELIGKNEKDLPTLKELENSSIGSVSEHFLLQYLRSKPTKQLKEAIKQGDFLLCYRLMDKGARLNDLVDGTTPLTDAIDSTNLTSCKYLIDMGATPTVSESFRLQELWKTVGIRTPELFMTPRPTLCEPHLFFTGLGFRYLKECPESTLEDPIFQGKKIFLLNIADESFNDHYGALTRVFSENYRPFYEDIAKKFIVVRVLVDKPSQIVSMVKKIQWLWPNHSFGHWAIHAHGNQNLIRIGPNPDELLTLHSKAQIKEIAEALGPSVDMTVWACNAENLIARWSSWLENRALYASSTKPYRIIPKTFFSTVRKQDIFVPIFERNESREVVVYGGGQRIASTDVTEDQLPSEFVQKIEDYYAAPNRGQTSVGTQSTHSLIF